MSLTVTPVQPPRSMRLLALALSGVAGALLLALGLLTVADVASRNLRGQSILGAIEISTLLLVAVAFLGLAAAEADGRHVSVGLVEERLPLVWRARLGIARIAILVVLGLVLGIGMYGVLDSAMTRGETTNDVLRLPTWPAKAALLGSFALFFIVAVTKEVVVLRARRCGEDVPVSDVDATIIEAADERGAHHGR